MNEYDSDVDVVELDKQKGCNSVTYAPEFQIALISFIDLVGKCPATNVGQVQFVQKEYQVLKEELAQRETRSNVVASGNQTWQWKIMENQ